MELFVFQHAEYERLYNCTGLDIDSVPLERRTQFVPESIAISVLCAIYYVLYVPCIYSIWKHMRDNSCYKLLFYIGVTDIGILWALGFFTAWAHIHGAVFCSNPTLMYFVGMVVVVIWPAETTADLVLAFNRCLDVLSPHFAQLLFSGHRTSVWLVGCSLYALYWAMFVKPSVYNSLYFGGWLYFPFAGYRSDEQHELYEHWVHPVHNIVVAVLSPLIYLIFVVKLFYDIRKNRRDFGTMFSQLDATQIRIFAQVFLLSLINTMTGYLYVYIQNHEVGQWMITVAAFAWLNVHGFPPVIYLALNKTIRDDCRLLYMKLFKRHRVSRVSGITVLRSEVNHRQQRGVTATVGP